MCFRLALTMSYPGRLRQSLFRAAGAARAAARQRREAAAERHDVQRGGKTGGCGAFFFRIQGG